VVRVKKVKPPGAVEPGGCLRENQKRVEGKENTAAIKEIGKQTRDTAWMELH